MAVVLTWSVLAVPAGAVTDWFANPEPTPWPSDMFTLGYQAEGLGPVIDVAEAADGAFLIAHSSGAIRMLTADGRPRTLANLGTGIAGIAAGAGGSVLVLEMAQIVRVTRTGETTTVAGTGTPGFSGDGGPALAAQIHASDAAGITRTHDGSIVFADQENDRLRRIRPDGTIETIAGRGSDPPCRTAGVGDGGLATHACLSLPKDVVETSGGSLLVADSNNFRIRRIAPDGTISTIAGNGELSLLRPSEEGSPAATTSIWPSGGLAVLRGGDLVFTDFLQLDRIARDGTWHTYLPRVSTDFAGRTNGTQGPEAITSTREGGVLIAWGALYYRAPAHTGRTLVRIRGALSARRRFAAYIQATRPGRATLEALRDGRVIARATKRIHTGRNAMRLPGLLFSGPHDIRVTLHGPRGTLARDEASLYLGGTLGLSYAKKLVDDWDGDFLKKDEDPPCRRIDQRQIDCGPFTDYDSGRSWTDSFRLLPDGAVSLNGDRIPVSSYSAIARNACVAQHAVGPIRATVRSVRRHHKGVDHGFETHYAFLAGGVCACALCRCAGGGRGLADAGRPLGPGPDGFVERPSPGTTGGVRCAGQRARGLVWLRRHHECRADRGAPGGQRGLAAAGRHGSESVLLRGGVRRTGRRVRSRVSLP